MAFPMYVPRAVGANASAQLPQPIALGLGLVLVAPLGHEGARGQHVVQQGGDSLNGWLDG